MQGSLWKTGVIFLWSLFFIMIPAFVTTPHSHLSCQNTISKIEFDRGKKKHREKKKHKGKVKVVTTVDQQVGNFIKGKVRSHRRLKKKKKDCKGSYIWWYKVPVEVWVCPGEVAVVFCLPVYTSRTKKHAGPDYSEQGRRAEMWRLQRYRVEELHNKVI